MGKLVYATNTSLDGFTEDATGSFDWTPGLLSPWPPIMPVM